MFREQGRRKALLAALVSAALMAGATWSVAADKPEAKPGAGMHGGRGMGAMGGMQEMEGMGGMMGMMDMMGSCSRMMQGGSMAHGIPQLPPGNAKLQLQMHAEMMQKMGETLAKYAAQIREDKK
jgi:hypothetical protein